MGDSTTITLNKEELRKMPYDVFVEVINTAIAEKRSEKIGDKDSSTTINNGWER